MSTAIEKTTRTLDELNVRTAADLTLLFAALRETFARELAQTASLDSWKELRDRWVSRKKGVLTQIKNQWLQAAGPELKPEVGKHLNHLRAEVETALEQRQASLASQPASAEGLDLTLPGLAVRRGARHLITQTIEEITAIFARIGFSVVEGPEVETDYYNFEALNIPADHPARDTMDTFYLDVPYAALPDEVRGSHTSSERPLLRTHTSPVQIRTLEKQKPPVRVIVPGKVYRRDNPDATHSFMFHQVEGLAVDRDITFCEFKGTMEYFLREYFGPQTKTRFSASYFPFTEPSADLAASCGVCQGAGCPTCKHTGWIELFGAGMVDPAVYGFVGYDPRELSGFAFGMGVERFAMVKYGIDDLQLFFQNDVRFLQQFRR
ncbi:MAG: phenylalanine--tRNA ligase subunit alpha [Candidatus Acidiferrales bacterium]